LELYRPEKVMEQAQKMETPDNWAGRMTKELMAVWLGKVKAAGEPVPSARVYNSAWSAAYEVLVRIAKG
jgi:hypothetical protein